MSSTVKKQSDGVMVPMQGPVGKPQQEASNPYTSVWVGASAGSGKTKVLADRVIRLLLSGVPPQRILCLTFTKAAAAEMAIRITRQLQSWAVCTENVLRDDLDKLQGHVPQEEQLVTARRLFAQVLQCPGGMRIRTIHAFAQEILRRFPLEAGVSPHFAVMEESEARALWHEALDNLLQNAAKAPDTALGKALTILVRERQEASFIDILREATLDPQRLNEAVVKAGGFDNLLVQIRHALGLDATETEISILGRAVEDAAFAVEKVRKAALIVHERGSKMFKPRGAAILNWLGLSAAQRREGFSEYSRAFLTSEGQPYKNFCNKEILAANSEIAEVLGVEASRLMNVAERLDTLAMAEQTAAMLTFALALNDAYDTRKVAQGVMDYGDLIRRTDALLHRPQIAPWVLYKLDGGIDHILVDEAQDTSPQQWLIVQILTDEFFAGLGARTERNRTLFVVGDEKQSIFSFQGADLAAFEAMRGYFAEHINAAEKPYQEVPLNISYRSAPAILQAVDAVFARDEAREGVSHDAVSHTPHWHHVPGRVEVWPLQVAADAEDQSGMNWVLPVGYEPTQDPAAALANLLARQIKDWWISGSLVHDRDTNQNRAMNPGDVMVLVRQRGKFVNHLVRALKALDVPVTGIDRMRLTEQLAVKDLMALLQFTLLPEDDLTLATVLRGPLLSCSEDQLMALAIKRSGSLWHSLNVKAESDQAFLRMRDYLRRWLNEADQATPFAMLAAILSQTCPADDISGRRALWKRLGPDAQDPIDEMLNAAQDFSARHTPSLQSFLRWLMETEAEIKRELDQGMGQVRITTVHASKGLQAPIVILPDTTSVPETRKLSKILWQGTLPFYVPKTPVNTMLRELRDEARSRQLEEYRRLLYVALTRAADRLYVCGWKNKPEKDSDDNTDTEITKASWYDLVRDALASHHNPNAEIMSGAVPPDIVLEDSVYTIAQKQTDKITPAAVAKPLPDWARRVPAAEALPLRRLKPSGMAALEPPLASPIAVAEGKRRFARGRIIHRLLQSLPDVAAEKQEAVAARFLANPQHDLDAEAQGEVLREVMALLRHPDYAPLFAPGSRAEVPIIGYTEDQEIPGQVDRLAVREGEVWIVDYKTNRPPPADVSGVPEIYRRQMGAYSAVLKAIYPDKSVRCFLLWTYGPRLMELPQEFLPAP